MFLNKKKEKQINNLQHEKTGKKNKYTSVRHQSRETFPSKFQHPELLWMLPYNTPTKQVGSAYKCWAVDEQGNAGRQGA